MRLDRHFCVVRAVADDVMSKSLNRSKLDLALLRRGGHGRAGEDLDRKDFVPMRVGIHAFHAKPRTETRNFPFLQAESGRFRVSVLVVT